MYLYGKVLPNRDVQTFQLVKETTYQYTKDKNHVYYKGQVIPLLQPASFRIIDSCYGDFEDDNYKYKAWNLVEK